MLWLVMKVFAQAFDTQLDAVIYRMFETGEDERLVTLSHIALSIE